MLPAEGHKSGPVGRVKKGSAWWHQVKASGGRGGVGFDVIGISQLGAEG